MYVEQVNAVIELIARALEIVGVAAIALAFAYALLFGLLHASRRRPHEIWRETWDSMALASQFRFVLIAVVTLTMLLVQLAVASYEIVANYRESRDHVAQVSTSISQSDATLSSSAILAGVQAHPSVIAATLRLPAGDVLWRQASRPFSPSEPQPTAVSGPSIWQPPFPRSMRS